MINIFRKKNKFTVFLALTAAILMLCTGCVRSGVGITIEPNDTGTVEISVGINEKYLDTLKEYSESENPFAGEDTVTVTDGDDKYICTVEKKTFKNLEELKTILLELEYNFASLEDEGFSMDDDTLDFDSEDDGDDNVWVTSDGEVIPLDENTDEEEDNYRIFKAAEIAHTSNFIGDTYRFSVTTMAHETDTEDLAMFGMDGGDLYKLTVDITMPGKMTAEGAVITEHTASFTVTDLAAEHVLTAESSSINISGIVAVSIAAVVLIAVLVFVFGRKKQQIS